MGTSGRDRKRDAGTPVNAPKAKKARIEDEEDVNISHDDEAEAGREASPVDADMENVEAPVEGIANEVYPPINPSAANTKKKDRGNGGFKENPYTYISPDDAILRGCMYVMPLISILFAKSTNMELTERVSTFLNPSLHPMSLCATRMARPSARSTSPTGSSKPSCSIMIIRGYAS